MAILTFLDIVQKESFRESVLQRLRAGIGNPTFVFPEKFPRLYKYRGLSKYAVNDIVHHTVTATSIGSFNDLFDGAIHKYGSKEEIEQAAEQEWREFEEAFQKAGFPGPILSHDDYTEQRRSYFRTKSRLIFRLSDYVGTYAACFSTENDSVLMWAHYADSQKGICIAYDFNQWGKEALQRKLLFPVAYSNVPVDVSDLVDNQKDKIAEYPLDEAVLCAAINKSDVWKYENEWRMIIVLDGKTQRIPLNILVNPIAIYFGYHFLKSFFYYDGKDSKETDRAKDQAKESLNSFNKLIDFAIENEIPVFLMLPNIRSYGMKELKADAAKLKKFVNQEFEGQTPKEIRFYNSIHDDLIELFEEEL